MSDSSKKPPGQVAYEAYEKRFGSFYHNHVTDPWEDLDDLKKEAWSVAAVALQNAIEDDLPETTVHVEKDSGDREKRAWSPVCTKCGGKGRPIKGDGEYANARHCTDCDVLFGWQVKPLGDLDATR